VDPNRWLDNVLVASRTRYVQLCATGHAQPKPSFSEFPETRTDLLEYFDVFRHEQLLAKLPRVCPECSATAVPAAGDPAWVPDPAAAAAESSSRELVFATFRGEQYGLLPVVRPQSPRAERARGPARDDAPRANQAPLCPPPATDQACRALGTEPGHGTDGNQDEPRTHTETG